MKSKIWVRYIVTKNTEKYKNQKIKVQNWLARFYFIRKRKLGCWAVLDGIPKYKCSIFEVWNSIFSTQSSTYTATYFTFMTNVIFDADQMT